MSVLPSLPEFVFTEKLGKGAHATVYKAYRKGGKREVVAVKCISKASLTKASVENIITEIEILKKVKHENIVELKDFRWDSTYIYLILEYCDRGDLSNFIKSKRRLPEDVVQRFLQQLASALKELRSHNIAHMDLKPQNILLTNAKYPILKVGDFGLSQYLQSESEATSFRGSPLYMAPEILLKNQYDATVDLWSVGIILYECLFGHAPFSSTTFAKLAEKIKSTEPIKIPEGAAISDNCRELILGLLQRDPRKRISFDQFFNDPFVDLEHMPTKESFAKGVSLANQAVKEDKNGEFEDASETYFEALRYLVPHTYKETNRTKREQLETKVQEYLSRIDELKGKTKKISTPQGSVICLENLIKEKPELEKPFYLLDQVDHLLVAGCNNDAEELLKKSLDILVPLVIAEPPGPKKEFLYKEVSQWMDRAETLKNYTKEIKREREAAKLQRLKETDSISNMFTENMDSACFIQ